VEHSFGTLSEQTTLNLSEHSVNAYEEWLPKTADLGQLALFFESAILRENSSALRFSYHQQEQNFIEYRKNNNMV